MIVFDLKCSQDHRFEGWFRATADFLEQQETGLLTCPHCGCADVGKAPMAPAVPKKGGAGAETKHPASPTKEESGHALMQHKLPEELVQALSKLAALQSEALKTSTWVGNDFAERSRAMHYGEEEAGPIHGRADWEEAEALLDEGVVIAPILIPFAPPDEVN